MYRCKLSLEMEDVSINLCRLFLFLSHLTCFSSIHINHFINTLWMINNILNAYCIFNPSVKYFWSISEYNSLYLVPSIKCEIKVIVIPAMCGQGCGQVIVLLLVAQALPSLDALSAVLWVKWDYMTSTFMPVYPGNTDSLDLQRWSKVWNTSAVQHREDSERPL